MDSQYLRIMQAHSQYHYEIQGENLSNWKPEGTIKKKDLQHQGLQNLDYHITDYKITMHKMFKLVKKNEQIQSLLKTTRWI